MRFGGSASVQSGKSQLERSAAELLEILYFVHDKGISALGATMRGQLSRTQAAILWLIRSEGKNSRSMLRKDVARRLHNWFDLGSPAITTALQGLAQPPLGLVRLIENADSAREKKVLLTARGERYIASMAGRGRHLVRELLADLEKSLSVNEIAAGVEFLRLSVSFFQRIYPGPGLNAKNPGRAHGPRIEEGDRERLHHPRHRGEDVGRVEQKRANMRDRVLRMKEA
jgi:DNA-binding MarR family transcriptional regulator